MQTHDDLTQQFCAILSVDRDMLDTISARSNWRCDLKERTLTHSFWGYEIDLRLCRNDREIMDWIFRVWCRPETSYEDVGQLVEWLGFLFRYAPRIDTCWPNSRLANSPKKGGGG
jgi:hypothetical protein